MRNTSRFLVGAVAVFALLLPGCKETTPTEPPPPEQPPAPEQLFSHMNVSLGATAAAAAYAGAVQDSRFENEPDIMRFQVRGPNSDIRGWPQIQDLPMSASWIGDGEVTMSWPPVSTSLWPDLEVAGGVRFGNIWFGFPDGGSVAANRQSSSAFEDAIVWILQHVEWVRRPHEVAGTTYPLVVKLLGAEPCNDCPVVFLMAGPSRHVSNIPLYQRRTNFVWFRYGDLSPWVWPLPNTGEPPGPPELTEVHIWVSGVSATLADGTVIAFPNQIGDIELFSINGQSRQVADSAVPQGEVASLSFTFDPAQSWVRAGGAMVPLNFGATTIVIPGPWTVGDNNFTTVTLTIDIDASVTYNESDGSWTFAPVLVITVTTGQQ